MAYAIFQIMRHAMALEVEINYTLQVGDHHA